MRLKEVTKGGNLDLLYKQYICEELTRQGLGLGL